MRSLAFVALTFFSSWSLWAAAGALQGWDLSRRTGLAPVAGSLYLLGVFAPAIVALGLTYMTAGGSASNALLRRTLRWSVARRCYVFAVGYFVTVKLAVALAFRLSSGHWPVFTTSPWLLMPVAIVFSTPVQAGEEIGWRGYLLPRLSTRLGLPIASLVVGLIWASWHLPFFLLAGTDKSGQSFPAYLAAVTALSVAMAWLYWRTGGSLLLTMLMHAAVNNTNLVPTPAPAANRPFTLAAPSTAWGTAALLGVGAAYFLVAMRGQRRVAPD